MSLRSPGAPVSEGQDLEATAGTRAPVGRGASGAVVTQFVTAGGSLVLQVLAARMLGADGYGTFTIILGSLIMTTAIQSAWVGDSLTVLDRHAPDIQGALMASHLGFLVLGVTLAAGGALIFDLTDGSGALALSVLLALWITEELGRRIFMARLEFWKLVLNDAIYVGGALLTLALLRWSGKSVGLDDFLLAMAGGAAAAILAALIQLPRSEFWVVRPRTQALGQVARFAGWRSAQAAIRPFSLLVVRVVIAGFASRAVLGNVEAARLLIAPALTFIAGGGWYMLSVHSDQQRGDNKPRAISVGSATAILSGAAVIYGACALVFLDFLSTILTASSFEISRGAVMAWVVFTLAFAAGLPANCAAIALRRSREVFVARILDSALGLALMTALVLTNNPTMAPYGLAVGMCVGTLILWKFTSGVPTVNS